MAVIRPMPSAALARRTPRRDAPSLSAPSRRSRAPRAAPGFTLIELLVVMVVIALLFSITVGSAQHVVRASREKRYSMTCLALETAISRYRHEYGAWPIPAGYTPDANYTVTVPGKDNRLLFDRLRQSNSDANANGIRFLDETSLLSVRNPNDPATAEGADPRQPMDRARQEFGNGTPLPIAYIAFWSKPKDADKALDGHTHPDAYAAYKDLPDGRTAYFFVKVNNNDDTVDVY